ncbi:hypothetical protein KM043_003673 [Ampulex compressa]|nr:hypothetical protein KM043_003673 [Ampulex compressa]
MYGYRFEATPEVRGSNEDQDRHARGRILLELRGQNPMQPCGLVTKRGGGRKVAVVLERRSVAGDLNALPNSHE